MPDSAILTFTDPHEYQAAVRASDAKFIVTAPGKYRAELTRINLHRLWMQRGWDSLPRVAHTAVHKDRLPILFLADVHQTPIHHCGKEMSAGEIVFGSSGAEHYYRTPMASHWASMSLTPEALAAAGQFLVGQELTAPAVTNLIRPPPELMSRLQRLHEAAGRLAATAPDILAHPEVARAMEQELVRTMVACLTRGMAVEAGGTGNRCVPVMQRFEQVLEANQGRALYLAEICAEIGVADRTLRAHCQEHLGMSPHRYLWLRRMHLVRRALALADPTATTVTVVATDHGFGELGRFAVSYRKLFGETPSTTLRRPPDHRPIVEDQPFR